MQFADLLSLQHDTNSGVIDEQALRAACPNTPEEVRQQLFADHGRKRDFQSQYGHFSLDQLQWHRMNLAADEILGCSIYPIFCAWVNNVAARVAHLRQSNWDCIDVRPAVVSHWRKDRTWLVAPVFFAQHVIPVIRGLHLAEGHTRVGILKGLVEREILSSGTRHSVWIGSPVAAAPPQSVSGQKVDRKSRDC